MTRPFRLKMVLKGPGGLAMQTRSVGNVPDQAADPIGDVDELARELKAQQIPLPRYLHVAYLVRIDGTADAAGSARATADAGGWSTSVYDDRGGRVLRLARESMLTTEQLSDDRRWLRRFVKAAGGRCDGMVIEDLRPTNYWDDFARRCFLRTAPALAAAGAVVAGSAEHAESASARTA